MIHYQILKRRLDMTNMALMIQLKALAVVLVASVEASVDLKISSHNSLEEVEQEIQMLHNKVLI